MENLVTIAIPVYNVRDYIGRSLGSALNQTFEAYEVLLIDDCSPDDSMTVAREVIAQHPRGDRVRIVEHKVNKGLGEVRNTAIAECRTPYLYFMDSDDEITSDCISVLYREFERNPDADYVSGNHVSVVSGRKDVPALVCERIVLKGTEEYVLIGRGGNYLSGSECNKLYRVEFLRDNRIRNLHRIGEDHYWCLQEAAFCRKIVCVPQVTYFYHLREGSITNGYHVTSFPPKLVEALLQSFVDRVKFVGALEIPERKYLAYSLTGQLFFLPMQVFESGLKRPKQRIETLFSDSVRDVLIPLLRDEEFQLPKDRRIGLFAFQLPHILIYPYWRMVYMVFKIYTFIGKWRK